MTDIHVDDFYKDSAVILCQLYNTFPRPNTLYVEDIIGPDEPDEFGLQSKRHLACFATMLWLGEEGYLRYTDTIRQIAIDQAVLTHHAFVLISGQYELRPLPSEEEAALPTSVLEHRSSNINQLRLAINSGSSNALRAIVRYLLARWR
jgi:hypothetical protein